jgi:predicted MPP superfamily phosphohydrolase
MEFEMISRRQLLGTGGLLSLPGILSTATTHAQELSLRAIHITDVHITHEHDAVSGVVAMFDHASKRKPDLILNTGDSVMAVNGKITGSRSSQAD